MSKTLMVTGASKGIGLETVRRFLQNDAEVTTIVLVARESEDYTQALAELEEINERGVTLAPYFADLADRGGVIRLCAEIVKAHATSTSSSTTPGTRSPCRCSRSTSPTSSARSR